MDTGGGGGGGDWVISYQYFRLLETVPPSVGVVNGSIGHFPRYHNAARQGPDVALCLPGFQCLGVNCEGTCRPYHLKGEAPSYAKHYVVLLCFQASIFEQLDLGTLSRPSS